MERGEMSYCTTLHVFWKWNCGGLKFMFEVAFCVHAKRDFFHFDRLYLLTDVSPGDRKGVIFLSFDSSSMWCEQFCPGRTFLF